MRRRGLTIFWPQYFDKKTGVFSSGVGFQKTDGTPKPTVEELLKAATNLGYYTELEQMVKYPRTWWDDPGQILIDTMGQKKTFVLHKLAEELKKVHLEKQNEAQLSKKKKKKKINTEALKEKIAKRKGNKPK